MGTGRIPYLLGYHEIAYLFRVARDAPLQWRKRGLLRGPDLVISGSPFWLLPTVFKLTKPGYREIDPQRLAGYKAGIPGGYATQELEEPLSLIGIQEVSWIFDKKPSVIGQWRNRGTLPPPELTLSGSPLWRLETILTDAERRERSVSAVAVARIRAGERAHPKSRGSARSDAGKQESVPPAQIFTSEERSAATRFVQIVLSAGHAVEIRPRRSGLSIPYLDGLSEGNSPNGVDS